MPRIRTVKPEFFTHPEVVPCSIPARLLLVSLFTQADDKGRLYDQPRKIGGLAFADTDRVKVDRLLAELVERGRLCSYLADGKACFHVLNFLHHQTISKPSPSRIPPCPLHESSRNTPGVLPERSIPEVEVEQGSGSGKEQGTGNMIAPTTARERDPLWDSLVACYGEPPTTSRFRGAWNAALADIRQQPDADPDEIVRRFQVGKASKDDWQVATPVALAKYWGQLGKPPTNGSAGTREVARQLREAGQ